MIAPMKRAFVVVLDREKRQALGVLRRLGLLHIEPLSGEGEEFDSLTSARSAVAEALGHLSDFKAPPSGGPLSDREGLDLAHDVARLVAERKDALSEAASVSLEIERVQPWGDFDPATAAWLSSKGLALRLVELPAKKLAALPEGVDYVRLGEEKGRARIAVLPGEGGAAVELISDCMEFRMPEASLSALGSRREAAAKRADDARAALAALAPRRGALAQVLARLERDVAFEAARSGMPVQGEVAWFAAWVPAASADRLAAKAAEQGYGLILDDPLAEEQPPTKVENNAFVRMIQPVFDFLGTVPNYREYDISAYFLVFFSLFFAMIFGDGGYGSIMLIAAIALAIKAKASGKRVPDMIRLLILLSGTTVVWGTLTMSWFGLGADKIPPALQRLSVYWISNANPESGNNVKVFCFVVGVIQFVIAHVKNIIRDRRSPKWLGQLGQLLMVIGMFSVVLNLVISSTKYPIPAWSLYCVLAGFALNFIFANWGGEKNFFVALGKSVLSSCANIVSVFLGVVNVFADIVSYIRLWAVGLAGVAISQTVNSMADPMFAKAIMFVFGIVLVVFGHGLNIIMSVLSVIVHGVRLNVLEFSSHLGMEWSGYKYEPFVDPVRDERAELERSPS